MFRLDGKVALVTGGSRGIGRACCEALAEQGATVVVNYVKGEAAAREVGRGHREPRAARPSRRASTWPTSKAVDAAIDALVKRHGKLDILVANAGIAIDGLLLRLKDEDLDRLFATTCGARIACARAAAEGDDARQAGRIVFLSSVVGEMGNVGQTAYAATKAALLGRGQVDRARVRVAQHHGQRRRARLHRHRHDGDDDRRDEGADAEGHPARPHRHARATSPPRAPTSRATRPAYVTGQVLRVNGGMYV